MSNASNSGITGPSSFPPVVILYLSHWFACNGARPVGSPLLIRLPDKEVTVARSVLDGYKDALNTQNGVLQGALVDQQVARGAIVLRKEKLLARFNQFNMFLDGNYTETDFYAARPYAPSVSDGQEVFSRAILSAVKLWERINAGDPPAGVTLPVVLPETDDLPGTMDVGAFTSLLSALQFDYAEELDKGLGVTIARAGRDRIQNKIYPILKAYRENVPSKMSAFPELVETMPRLSPLPGHTPTPVNASAIFEAPDKSKTVYDPPTDSDVHSIQLRGHVGDEYDPDLAVVIANNGPNDPREFISTFGLNQPGVHLALKVFVMLNTGNEAGSAPMVVQRPFAAAA